MYILTHDSRCLLCDRILRKGKFIISVFIADNNYHFCPTHESNNYNDLVVAVLKLHIINKGHRPLPPITKLEWLILEKAGAILP